MKKLFIFLFILFTLLIIIKYVLLSPANPNVRRKLSLIEKEVNDKGYSTNWFIISDKRHKWYNSLLLNSAKDSEHLKGNAIDIYVLDVDGDAEFNENDIKIIEKACKRLEKKYPELTGGFGTYLRKGYFTRHMVHIDTRGYYKRWY